MVFSYHSREYAEYHYRGSVAFDGPPTTQLGYQNP
jgi:hypothetical protein